MEEFAENLYSFEYSGTLHSTDDTNDNDDEEDKNYPPITVETEDVEEGINEPEQINLGIDKNLDIPIVTDDE